MSRLNFNEYQDTAEKHAIFDAAHVNPPPAVYEAMGLAGEAGEVVDTIKKYWRDGGDFGDVREAVGLELGDTLWYLSQVALKWGFTLEAIAQMNQVKLADRRARGVVRGSGNKR